MIICNPVLIPLTYQPNNFIGMNHQHNIYPGGFFTHVGQVYGENTRRIMKDLSNHRVKLAHMKNRKIFLLQCCQKLIFPTHIINNINCINVLQFDHHPFTHEVNRLIINIRTKVMNLEIKITIWKLKSLEEACRNCEDSLKETLPREMFISCINANLRRFETEFAKTKIFER